MFDEEIEHYMSMPAFASIYYDEYRDVYYRIWKFPKKRDFDPNKSDSIDLMANPRDFFFIIVLNNKFQKLTEYTIPQPEEGVYFENWFVNEKGFYITYIDYGNEDELIFKQFILKQDNN